MNSWGASWNGDGYFKLDFENMWNATSGTIQKADFVTNPKDTWGPNENADTSQGNCAYKNEFGICLKCKSG